jgi:OPA family glycerol-3-phosphate transporter-like MFS transporter/OPA family sugar phosphate sensor protein UhpC-like MFS transporter
MSAADELAPIATPDVIATARIESDAATEQASVAYWQRRILTSTIIGYALFYFVRKNLSVAMPAMEAAGITKVQLGWFLTTHGVLYGVSKFTNGIIGDRVNARWFMAIGLAYCAVINILCGLSASVLAFGLLWAANGWFQGIGYPPCARLMTHWFSPHQLATKMGTWNISHSLGAGVVVVMCGYLVHYNWRLCFFVPAGIALFGAAMLAIMLRDTPESLGLPAIEGTTDLKDDSESLSGSLRRLVFANPHIWLLSIANFFVYSIRQGLLDWGPTFLKQARGIDITSATWFVAGYEGFGLLGMLVGGWITDRVFAGRAARACLFYMICCSVTLLLFWFLPNQTRPTSAVLLWMAGFFVYGPQSLIGAAAANLATKRAAAAAVGLTGFFGYLSTAVSGVGIGALVEHNGWDAGFLVFFGCGLIGTLLFAFCWTAKAHGYSVPDATTD